MNSNVSIIIYIITEDNRESDELNGANELKIRTSKNLKSVVYCSPQKHGFDVFSGIVTIDGSRRLKAGLDLHTMTDFHQEVGSQIPYSAMPDTGEGAMRATEGMLHCEGRSTDTCA